MNQEILGVITVGHLLALLGGGLGVSIVAQVIKRVAGLESSKVIHFMVGAVSVVGVGLTDIIFALHNSPSLLGSHTLEVLGLANAAHTFIVSDADTFLNKVRVALKDENVATAAIAGSTAIPAATDASSNVQTPPPAAF